jgi:hypothetical protein
MHAPDNLSLRNNAALVNPRELKHWLNKAQVSAGDA